MKLKDSDLIKLEEDGYLMVPSFFDDGDTAPDINENIRFCDKYFPELKPLISKLTDFIVTNYPKAKLIRTILFNKSDNQNWSVRWHQDSTICVQEKVDVEEFGPWSVKDEIPHVRVSPDYLDSMITARFHFDKATEENGALQVVPGSHHLGFIPRDKIRSMTKTSVTCEAEKGDILLMKPLILKVIILLIKDLAEPLAV